jgi:hypothetical protein
MAGKPILTAIPHSLLAFAISIIPGEGPAAAADLPVSPGVGFAMAGIASGQTARINALSVGPGTCGGGVTLEFYAADTQLLKRTFIPNLEPGKAAFLDLSRDELPKGAARTEVRAVLRFGYAGGEPPAAETLRRFECNILPSLEIFENATGRANLLLTDARPLPGPNPPRK